MKKIFILTLGTVFLIASCGRIAAAEAPSASTATPLSPTVTATVTPTLAPTETFTPSPTPTETWIAQGPGDVTVPILLYHHIDVSPNSSRYYVPPKKFEEQIKLLHDWGYESITTDMLVQAILTGVELPPRPLIITFDDGHMDNYTTAYPIMQRYGFKGVLYLVANYIGTEGYMDVDQILEMHNAGWEVGSHSMNHLDLTKLDPDKLRDETVGSRKALEERLGIPILTFAYPFGYYDNSVMDYVQFAGYIGAMGASGYTPAQGKWNLFYLQRVEIKSSEDAKTFTRFLPWHGDPTYLPTDTPTPKLTPSHTPNP